VCRSEPAAASSSAAQPPSGSSALPSAEYAQARAYSSFAGAWRGGVSGSAGRVGMFACGSSGGMPWGSSVSRAGCSGARRWVHAAAFSSQPAWAATSSPLPLVRNVAVPGAAPMLAALRRLPLCRQAQPAPLLQRHRSTAGPRSAMGSRSLLKLAVHAQHWIKQPLCRL